VAAILAASCSETRNPVAVSTTGVQAGGDTATAPHACRPP